MTVRRSGGVATARAALGLLRAFGVRGLLLRLRSLPDRAGRDAAYRRWIAAHDRTPEELKRLAEDVAALPNRPLISIVVPVRDTDPAWLTACVASVRRQVYPEWQLVLCDDASTRLDTRQALDGFAGDSRIEVIHLTAARHISGATNAAIQAARGTFLAFVDSDDELAPDALAEVVRALNDRVDLDVVYTDEDKLDETGRRTEPFFKPDWSPEYLLSTMYVGHLTVVRRALVEELGGLRDECTGSQDYDLTLRLAERTSRVHHVPRILYHWRKARGSTAVVGAIKPWAAEAAKRALSDHLRRRGIAGRVTSGPAHGQYRVRVDPPDALVSVVVVGDAGRVPPGAGAGAPPRVHGGSARVEWLFAEGTPGESWPVVVNRAARRATGSYLACLSAGLQPLSPDWLDVLVGFASLEGVGAVGGRVLGRDGRVFQAGIATGVAGDDGRIFAGARADDPGYVWNLQGVRNCAAVSAACLVTSRLVFDAVGGFDEGLTTGADIDYCLKVRRQGSRVVCVPEASLRWTGPPARGFEGTDAASATGLAARWGDALRKDPYYNQHFARRRAHFRLPDDTD